MIAQTERFNELLHIGEVLQRNFMSHWRARQLPIIDIAGTKFYLDIRLEQLRDVDNWANQIPFKYLYETEKACQLYFDTKKKEQFLGERSELKPHIIKVDLPTIEKMDPLGSLWRATDQGWVSKEDCLAMTEKLLKDFNVHPESGMILQRKVVKPVLLEKNRINTNKRRGERL